MQQHQGVQSLDLEDQCLHPGVATAHHHLESKVRTNPGRAATVGTRGVTVCPQEGLARNGDLGVEDVLGEPGLSYQDHGGILDLGLITKVTYFCAVAH